MLSLGSTGDTHNMSESTFVDEDGSELLGPSDTSGWDQKNLLSLDGGGIRGLWSLLVLERLMEYIAKLEEKYPDNGHKIRSSFDPLPYPPNVSQIGITRRESRERRSSKPKWRNGVLCSPRSRSSDPAIEASNSKPLNVSGKEEPRDLAPSQRYLPCHYFDFICGSSTGALIAIMLGRLRMTVADCIREYTALGNEVFGRPRLFSTRYYLIGNRHLYDSDKFESILKDVIDRRREKYEGLRPETLLKSDGDLCRTILTALEADSDNPGWQRTFMFRSYTPRHTRMGSFDEDARTRPRGRTLSNLDLETQSKGTGRSLIEAKRGQLERERTVSDVPLWLAAKAATAADLFFRSVKIPSRQGTMIFRDGGFGSNNNPCWLGTQELKDEFGKDAIGSVISIGTARQNKFLESKGPFKSISATVSGWVDNMTDPTPNHVRMLEASSEQGFFYQRLNSDHGLIPQAMLTVALDEWDPRNHWWTTQQPGANTLRKIELSFQRWAVSDEAETRLRSCAERLVRTRRERCANVARWERFACGVKYTCPCNEDQLAWTNKDNYVVHLFKHHAYTQKEVMVALEERSERWEYQPP